MASISAARPAATTLIRKPITYSIVGMDGCRYYLADNGCCYPAYGFDPSCNYPDGVVFGG